MGKASESYNIVYEKNGISAEELGDGIYILRCGEGEQKHFWQKRLIWSFVILIKGGTAHVKSFVSIDAVKQSQIREAYKAII